ncbi:MAG TPA: glycerophosphodiester phosphodiesterase family protein, partial [Candidatus Dormibacteraeota bacterium]|nr:glycerophosphodiester phosphodiesterase family protein [Candidatus Dormibacteraeota bacterium]
MALGLPVIECDVHLTADGQLAVIHDFSLDRTTDASGPVAARTMAELRRVDAGGGQPIPTLEEVLDLARGRVGVAIEIKIPPEGYPGIEAAVLARAGAAGMV